MTNYDVLKMQGMLGEFMNCSFNEDGGMYCDYCNMKNECNVRHERGCGFDWHEFFKNADWFSSMEMAAMMSAILYNVCDYCPVQDDGICGFGENGKCACTEALEEWLGEENWLAEPLLKNRK